MQVSNDRIYVEQDCTITHDGKSFTSGGAVVSPERIVAYLGKDNVLTDWHGNPIGTYRIVSTWKLPYWYYISTTMHQVEATVDNILYTGRSCGIGMLYRGKRKSRP